MQTALVEGVTIGDRDSEVIVAIFMADDALAVRNVQISAGVSNGTGAVYRVIDLKTSHELMKLMKLLDKAGFFAEFGRSDYAVVFKPE